MPLHLFKLKLQDGTDLRVRFDGNGYCPHHHHHPHPREAEPPPRNGYGPPTVDIQYPISGQVFMVGPDGSISVNSRVAITGAAGGQVGAKISDGTTDYPANTVIPGNETTPWVFVWSIRVPAGGYVLAVAATVTSIGPPPTSDTGSQSIGISVIVPPHYEEIPPPPPEEEEPPRPEGEEIPPPHAEQQEAPDRPDQAR
jgi:hypothetical protein